MPARKVPGHAGRFCLFFQASQNRACVLQGASCPKRFFQACGPLSCLRSSAASSYDARLPGARGAFILSPNSSKLSVRPPMRVMSETIFPDHEARFCLHSSAASSSDASLPGARGAFTYYPPSSSKSSMRPPTRVMSETIFSGARDAFLLALISRLKS